LWEEMHDDRTETWKKEKRDVVVLEKNTRKKPKHKTTNQWARTDCSEKKSNQ